MARASSNPRIYHITHVDNLAGIVQQGVIWSDAKRIELGINCQIVGMSNSKRRRLTLPVHCHPGTTLASTHRSTSARGLSCCTFIRGTIPS